MGHRASKSYYDKHNLSRYVSKRNSKIKRFFKSFGKWILLVFIAIIFGKFLNKHISENAMQKLSGVLFLIFGFIGFISM